MRELPAVVCVGSSEPFRIDSRSSRGTLRNACTTAGIEVRARRALDLDARRLEGYGHRIRPVAGHGIEGVGHREDARAEGNELAPEGGRVAGAVPALVVVVDDGHGAPEEGDALDEAAPQLRMGAHDLPLVHAEAAGLEQDAVGDADLADVVEEDAVLEIPHLAVGHAVGAGDGQGVADYPTRVGLGAHVAGVEGGSQRLESGQVRFFELGEGGGQAPGGFRHPALQHHLVFAPLGEELPALEGPLGGDEDFFHVDGLGDEVIGPGLEAFDGRLDIAHPGDDDDGGVSVHRAGALEEFEAVHHGHPDVGEGEGRALALEGLQALAAVRRHLRLVAVGGEDFPEGVPGPARRPPR